MERDRRAAGEAGDDGVKALLRFTPVFDPRMLDDPKLARHRMVQRGALEQANPNEPIPVVIDHDRGRRIGTVREIFTAPDVAGGVVQDWYFAAVDLTDAAHGWVKRGGAVSWKHIPLREQAVGETTRLLRGIVREVSILAPGTEPAEPLARVVLFERSSSLALPPAKFSDPLSRYGFKDGDDVEAFVTAAKRNELDKLYDERLTARVPARGVLIRPNIGQVLGVR